MLITFDSAAFLPVASSHFLKAAFMVVGIASSSEYFQFNME